MGGNPSQATTDASPAPAAALHEMRKLLSGGHSERRQRHTLASSHWRLPSTSRSAAGRMMRLLRIGNAALSLCVAQANACTAVSQEEQGTGISQK